jgi:hypothetical protein
MLVEHKKVLERVLKREGHFAEYPVKALDFLECRIYVEMLERLFLSIEDFTSVVFALLGDFDSFPKRIIHPEKPAKVLKSISADVWHRLLRYEDLARYELTGDEKVFIEGQRRKNVQHLQGITAALLKFVELNDQVFLKHKHGNLLRYGVSPIDVNGERMFFIPAFFRPQKPDNVAGVFVSARYYDIWGQMFDAVNLMTKDIVERSLIFIEQNQVGFIEHKPVHHELTDQEIDRLRNIIKRADVYPRVDINVVVKSEVKIERMQEAENYYQGIVRDLIR